MFKSLDQAMKQAKEIAQARGRDMIVVSVGEWYQVMTPKLADFQHPNKARYNVCYIY